MSICKEKFGDNNGVLQAQGSPGMTFTASWRGLLQQMCWSTLCSAGSSRRLSTAQSWSPCRRCAFSHVAENVIITLPAALVLAQARARAPGRAGPAARGEAAIPLHCT